MQKCFPRESVPFQMSKISPGYDFSCIHLRVQVTYLHEKTKMFMKYRRNYLKRFDKCPQKCSYSLSPTQELYQSHYSEQAEKINADNSLSRLSIKESFTVLIKADSTITLMLENVPESKNYKRLGYWHARSYFSCLFMRYHWNFFMYPWTL